MSTISASTTSTTAYKVTADTTGTLVLQTGATPTTAVTIDASQNVGIGTSSPSAKLEVNTSVLPIRLDAITSAPTSQTAVYVGPSSAALSGFNGDLVLAPRTSAAGSILFYTGNGTSAERARIDSSGNLLVGATSANTSADNRIVVTGTRAIDAKSTGGATAPTSVFWNNATTGDNIFVSFRTETSDTQRGSITYNRGAGLVAYNVTSDYRAKDIIGPVANSGALIDSTPVYMGKMKGATQERPMFIAHETPDYAHTGEKDAVDADGNPVYQQMDASALVPVMWAEIQSLRKRLTALENK